MPMVCVSGCRSLHRAAEKPKLNHLHGACERLDPGAAPMLQLQSHDFRGMQLSSLTSNLLLKLSTESSQPNVHER